VPKDADGEYVQPLDSVGTAELHGDSSGCIRVLPDDAELIWRWLSIGDTVTVVT
jgi:lipoprotein-anchoring transpeptidase ErfK/SrfK